MQQEILIIPDCLSQERIIFPIHFALVKRQYAHLIRTNETWNKPEKAEEWRAKLSQTTAVEQ